MGLLYSIKKKLRSISASSPSTASTSTDAACTAAAGSRFHQFGGGGGITNNCSNEFERPPVWLPRRVDSNIINHQTCQVQKQVSNNTAAALTSAIISNTATSSAADSSSSCVSPQIINAADDANDNYDLGTTKTTALFSYQAKRPDELTLNKDDEIKVLEKNDDGWWRGINLSSNNREGWFPSNFVRELYCLPTMNRSSALKSGINNTNQGVLAAAAASANVAKSSQQQKPKISAHVDLNNFPPTERAAPSDVSLPYSAMYNFKANNDDELSFERREVLTILDHPSCGHNWLRARNADGHVGLVPRNFIEPLSRVHTPEHMLVMSPTKQAANSESKRPRQPDGGHKTGSANIHNGDRIASSKLLLSEEGHGEKSAALLRRHISSAGDAADNGKDGSNNKIVPLPHKDNHSMSRRSSGGAMPSFIDHDVLLSRPWYYGRITRAQCDELLHRFGTIGSYLVRASETGSAGDFAISLRAVPRNKHFKVQCLVEKQVLCIGSRQFASIDAIIEHYQQTPICTLQSGDKLHLKTPLEAQRPTC